MKKSWRTADGRFIPIHAMADSHLENTIAALVRGYTISGQRFSTDNYLLLPHLQHEWRMRAALRARPELQELFDAAWAEDPEAMAVVHDVLEEFSKNVTVRDPLAPAPRVHRPRHF